jgi:hypothetical protein
LVQAASCSKVAKIRIQRMGMGGSASGGSSSQGAARATARRPNRRKLACVFRLSPAAIGKL